MHVQSASTKLTNRMLRWIWTLVIAVGSTLGPAALKAQDYDMSATVPALKPFLRDAGGYYHPALNGNEAYLEVVISQSQSLANFQRMINSGAFAPDLRDTVSDALPYSRCYYIAEQAAALAAVELFGGRNITRAHIIAEMITPNAFGQDTYVKVFSMDLTRDLFQKINWKNFNPRNFSRVADNFSASSWFVIARTQEMQGFAVSPPPH